MKSAPVDLACREVWSQSLERSQARRARLGLSPSLHTHELLPLVPRDLADADLWTRSGWRSRARRDAAATRSEMPTPSPRGLSLAALLAVTGVPALGVVGGLVGKPGATAEANARVSSRGAGVSAMQRALGVGADGVFGPQTQKALRAYQRAHGLTVDGIAGPQTRARLGMGAGPVLKRGGRHGGARATRSVASRGGGVEGVQRAVGVSADGVFGPQTESAVKRWQGSHGLQADGVVGPLTRSKMGLGPGPVIKRKSAHGSSGGGGVGGSSVVSRVVAAANRIATTPYVYGGGHGSFTSSGYDCSGSVSYALHGGGLLSAPMASGGFMSYGESGPGRHITIYANAGHVFMTIDGRRYDTSARSQTGSRWGGAMRSTAGYVVRHPAGM